MTETQWLNLATILCGLTGASLYVPLLSIMDFVNSRFTRDLKNRASELGLKMSGLTLTLRWWWVFIIFTGLFLAFGLKMAPVAILVSLLLLSAPRTFLEWLTERRRIILRDQIVTAARALATQLRAGLQLPEGLRAVSRESPAPLSREFGRVVKEYDAGTPIQESLRALNQRLKIEAVSLFVVALLACLPHGGRVTDEMDRISRSLEMLQAVERKRDSNTAGGRTLVFCLSLFPGIFAGLFYMIDPNSMALVFTTMTGQLVICSSIVLTYIAVRWASWLIAAIE